jgi:DNA-directed RNA polymerase specialized sigma24 family protein
VNTADSSCADAEDFAPAERDPGPAVFATTHWSVVLTAGRNDTTRANKALSRLCQMYWYPLYVYVRRCGQAAAEAQDLTQEFFARLLENRWLDQADPQRGRFRSFLLSAMKHFLTNEWHKAHTQKRGGGLVLISLDDDSAEHRYALEPATESTPESLYERRWALALLEGVLLHLENAYRLEGKGELFDALKSSLTVNQRTRAYPDLAAKLGLAEGAVRVAVHRLRKRYRQLLRAEVAHTVSSSDEVDEEMRYLFLVLSRS